MTHPDPIRISFIGAGGICEQRHLPGLAQIPGIELVAVCNRSAESSRRIQQKWGFARIESDWRKVVDDPGVDVIFIGTWPYLHRELSIAALQAGKHVFCQARMCMNYAEAMEMVAVAAAHPQLVSMICPSPFRVRWERTIHRLLAAGELGELRAVTVCSLSSANVNRSPVSWRERIELSGDNILQVGIFAEALHAWFGEYATLSAMTSIPLPDKQDADGTNCTIRIPQVVHIQGTLRSGVAISEFHSGLSATECSEITFHGAERSCLVDLRAGQVSLWPRQAGEDRQIVDGIGDPWEVEADFIAAVRAARRCEPWRVSPDFPEAARYMRKMQALHESAASGNAVAIESADGR
jgi:predicted dehydrogenase